MTSDEVQFGKRIQLQEQEDLETYIEKQQQDPNIPIITNLDVDSSFATDAKLPPILAAFGKYLKRLYLGGCWALTDSGLKLLPTATSLEQLTLAATDISDAGLVYVANLPALQQLNLSHNEKISDAGLVHLANLTALQELDLSHNTNITEAGLQHLVNLPSLDPERINLGNTKVTEKGLEEFIKQLRENQGAAEMKAEEEEEAAAKKNTEESSATIAKQE